MLAVSVEGGGDLPLVLGGGGGGSGHMGAWKVWLFVVFTHQRRVSTVHTGRAALRWSCFFRLMSQVLLLWSCACSKLRACSLCA
jgi:hypothetical protein